VRAVLVAVAAAALLAGCGSAAADKAPPPKPVFDGVTIPADAPAEDFALHDQNGKLVQLSAQRGSYVFVAFLYTHCRDVCPLIATWLDNAARGHRNVQVLAVSVDPEGDTPAAVQEFVRARHLGPEFHWLIGSRTELQPVWQAYNILVEARTPEQIAHSAPVFLLDKHGRPKLFYATPKSGIPFRHDLRVLLSR
jgi:protein SCO1